MGDGPNGWAARANLGCRLLAIALLSGTAIACAHRLASAYDRLGISADGAEVKVSFVSCPGELVNYVRLYVLDGDNVAPDDGDTLIWEVNDPSASDLQTGIVPTDQTGDRLPLSASEEYYVEISTSRNVADSDSFEPTDLSPSTIRVNRKQVDSAQFEERATRSCG